MKFGEKINKIIIKEFDNEPAQDEMYLKNKLKPYK